MEPEVLGLDGTPVSQWEGAPAPSKTPIELLAPKSELHGSVLTYLIKRLGRSERAMAGFYKRWELAEKRVQTYIRPDDYEKALKEISDTGHPQMSAMVVPYSMAVVSTIVTYLANVFLGRRPMFQVWPMQAEMVDRAKNMEQVLQYQMDHTRGSSQLFKYFRDGEIYGLQVLKVLWENKYAERSTWRQVGGGMNLLGQMEPPRMERAREEKLIYSGCKVEAIDPFLFFPDPSVAMAEVNDKGEFVAVRDFVSIHRLKRMEAEGSIMYVNDIPRSMPRNDAVHSNRNFLLGDGTNVSDVRGTTEGKTTYQIDQFFIEIIPEELGVGAGTLPEIWVFAVANRSQIIQAQPLEYDHGRFPVVVGEPYSSGYGFGHPGIVDYHAQIQDGASWLWNSHMQNVREMINCNLVYNPYFVDEDSINDPGPGRRYRLKQQAAGIDIDRVIKQLAVTDVTRTHITDMQELMRMGDTLSATNQNLKGEIQYGGRKTATEITGAAESGSSRLAVHAQFISVQSIVDLCEQMSLLTQQFQEEPFYTQLMGPANASAGMLVGPEMLVGDFYYPASDGTVPYNKGMLFGVWQQILPLFLQDPELRARFDSGRLGEHVAELGGVRNLKAFMRAPQEQQQIQSEMMSDEMVAEEEAAGNLIPLRSA